MVGLLWDRSLQFATSWSLDQGKDGQERLESSFEISQKQAADHGDEITDEEMLQLALAMCLEAGDNDDTNEERFRRSLHSSIEADVDNQTNADRLQRD